MASVRPRVFVSSVITGYEPYRAAAATGIQDAGAEPVMVEQFPALNLSPRTACLDGIASCQAMVLVVGPRPGFKTASEKYVIEEEWQYARKHSTALHLFIQEGPLEPDAQRIAEEVSAYIHGRFRRTFKTPDELRERIAESLAGITKMSSEPDTSALDDALTASSNAGYETRIRLAIQPIRKAEIIDPLDLDSRQFQDSLLQLSTTGPSPLLSLRAKKAIKVTGSNLVFDQPGESGRDAEGWYARAILSTHGFLLAERAVGSPSRQSWDDAASLGLSLQLSDLSESIASLFQFVSLIYNQIDPYIAFRDLIYNVALVNLGHRYIYDVAPSPARGVPVRMGDNANILAFDSPRGIVREGLDASDEEIRRVVGLLRRKAQPER